MGISVAEYFANKEACQDCAEHGDEEHCVTTLLSRAENCFFYNATHMNIGDYTEEDREIVRNLRSSMTEEELVNYYVRGEQLIENMKLFEKPHYEQYAIITRIDFNYLQKIVKEIKKNNKEKVYSMTLNMLDEIEKEYPQGT
jgi:hypothetical protein